MAVQSAVGIAGLVAIAWLLSEQRRLVSWRIIAAGLIVQFLLALLLLKFPPSQTLFLGLTRLVDAVQAATIAGTSFVFGYVGGGRSPFAVTDPGAGFVLAFQALPLVLLMSALSALLYHWRILPLVVKAFSRLLERSMGLGGAVGVSSAANAFVGMVEAPLLIRPYLARLSRGELFVVMTGGMATIAGTMMVLYATFLTGVIPDPIGHLLTASLISVPAAIMVAKIMIPDDTRTGGQDDQPMVYASSMDAVVRGTADGVGLLINIIAMLIVLVALVALANGLLALLPEIAGAPVTLQRLMGLVMAPIVWLMGIPAAEMMTAGALMGTKTVLNELLAYVDLAHLPAGALSERSRVIMTYGLCGFANFGSLGIMIAGLAAMAPERRDDIVALGGRSIISGTLASCLTGAVVGILI
ncbi:putative Na+(H+)/nucleoside cotransporter [Magnetospirillum gryphiswaldense MSR-1 v2]|uniref:Na+(H+)/nucleoside cotransporter n=1 Tax=Magnetospirillum gryphiswaldense (strain DSM 6361 / JCM 21280 / NBRC 15271 / MSR-1) TaxID=431944 RepID=V6F725_MAGGM|nr:nucleoside transporter C-terminal domain-containing protein [Magnetospirillum gryphiswaldense]CDL01305.1 putative Na+(H+)/nucleoside cotransporter [Magnetospirillum gryphiswaldense MSR-1 v2]